MPTAAEYDLWAWGLDDRADELTGLLGPAVAAAAPDVLMGGTLAVTVDVALRASLANALDAAARLRELAEECRNRAQICRDFEAAWLDYERRHAAYRTALDEYAEAVDRAVAPGGYVGSPPSAPRPPVPPHAWVER